MHRGGLRPRRCDVPLPRAAAMASKGAAPQSPSRSLKKPGFGESGSSFRPTRLGITPICEDGKARAAAALRAQSSPELVKAAKSLSETQATYGTMSAKARGAKIHGGPLELRHSLPGRDCTSWVRANKQYAPYTILDNPNNKAQPKPKKSKGPPALWLPSRAKDVKGARGALIGDDGHDTLPLGAEAGGDEDSIPEVLAVEEPAHGSALLERPPWDSEHHVMFSRLNHEVQQNCREYFDKPVRREGEGIPKVRERYAMNDRQCGWNDEPGPLGEYRRTLYDNIGPYNIGGCKEHQLPSYWRKITDWTAFVEDDLKLSVTKSGKPKDKQIDPTDKFALLKSVADLPADKAVEFWRGWAEHKSGKNALPPKNRFEAPQGWDNRWNVCWSRANETVNQRQREYFSVPQGATGLATSPERLRMSMANIGRIAASMDRLKDL